MRPAATPVAKPAPTPVGPLLWTAQFGSVGNDVAWSVAVDGEGDVYVAGGMEDDAFLNKYDPDGSELWSVGFGSAKDDAALSLAVDGEGHVCVAGWTSGAVQGHASEGGQDAFLSKYDPEGAELWTRQFGSIENDSAWGVAVDGWGDVYVAGLRGGDGFLSKYGPKGMERWAIRFGSAGHDGAFGVAVDGEGNVYVAGTTGGDLPGQDALGDLDAFLIKYDSEGIELWTRQFGSHDEDVARSVAVDQEGDIYVAGLTRGALPGQASKGDKDAFLIKFDPEGEELWTLQLGSAEEDVAWSVSVDGDGNVHVAGRTEGLPHQASEGGEDAFLIKFDPAGMELRTVQIGSSDNDGAFGVAVDSEGHIYMAGEAGGDLPGRTSAGGSDAFVVQVRP